jgi:hypothetical protein
MNGEAQPGPGEGPSSDSVFVPLTRSPGFWVIVRRAVLFGVVLAFVALAFLALVDGGTRLWFTLPKHPGWLDENLRWVAVTAGAGVLVGVLRRFLRVPAKVPGTIAEIKDARVDPSTVPGTVAVSLVPLAGGGEPRARGRTGEAGRPAGHLGLGPAEAQRRRESDEHPERHLRGVPGASCHPRFWRRFSCSR